MSPRPAGAAAPRAALLALVLALVGGAWGQPAWLELRGEASVSGAVQRLAVEGLPDATVARPLTLAARLDATATLADDAELVALLAPAIAFGRPDGPSDAPLASPGLQDAYLRLAPTREVEVGVGVQRWPLGELRLAPTLRLEPLDRFGTARGLLGARLTAYLHPWRVRVGAAAPLDDDLRPTSWGGVASLRWDVASWTLEASALALDRIGGGLSASGTVDRLVLTGDVWLLEGPWEVRGGVGASGYLGDLLVTAEAAWAPEGGALTGAPRPTVRVSGQTTLARDVALDLVAGAAWPEDPATPGARRPTWDAGAVLSFDRPDAVLSLAPTLRGGGGTTALGASLTLRTFF
jgi:hypothetical protein